MLGEEHRSKEDLLAENKMLKKQKEELILNFKKQHKLTDIHKRQKVKVVLLLHSLAESLDQNTDKLFFSVRCILSLTACCHLQRRSS